MNTLTKTKNIMGSTTAVKTLHYTDIKYLQDIDDLAEEIEILLSESRFSASMLIIETNHKIGETIANHPAYQKGKHGQGTLMRQLAIKTGKSEQHLYACLQFYEKYPKVSNALETLQPDSKKLTWRQVTASFSRSGKKPSCDHPEVYEIKFKCCRSCGSRIKENK